MSYVTAFWVGGLICALCQILEKTKLMPGRVMVILVCSGALFLEPFFLTSISRLWNLPVPVLRCRFSVSETYSGKVLKKQSMKMDF